MKNKKIIGISAVAAILAVFLIISTIFSGAQREASVKTAALEKTDLVDSVLVSGTVVSDDTINIYSKLSAYNIKEVYVEEGDKVKAGDLLAVLDTASLELDIKQAELNIRNAELSRQNEASTNSFNLQNASNALKTASIELENAQRNYDNIKRLSDTGSASNEELTQAEAALNKARLSYDNAETALNYNRSKNTSITVTNLEIQKVALEKQKTALNDARITSPINGTVTFAAAKENEPPTGLLFVVEDTENLVITTAVGEFDIGLVKTGQEVVIKTDGTGDREFSGSISKIAPAARKDAAGSAASSSNVQFDTEVRLDEYYPDIKIGMNVRLTIKVNEKKDVYAVPFDSIVTLEDTGEWIYFLESPDKSDKNNNIGKIRVETGMETDMYVEISSPELKDGLEVLLNPPEEAAAEVQP